MFHVSILNKFKDVWRGYLVQNAFLRRQAFQKTSIILDKHLNHCPFFSKLCLEIKWNLSFYIFYLIQSFFYQLSLLSATLPFSHVLLLCNGYGAPCWKQGYLWHISKGNNFNFEFSNWIKETKSWNSCLVTSKNAFHVEKSWNIKDVGISFPKLLHWILFSEGNGVLLKLSFVRKYHKTQHGCVMKKD